MIGEVGEFTLTCTEGNVYTVPLAKEIVPGLVVYRLPDGMPPYNPNRWPIGHKASGLAIADSARREAAVQGAERCADIADWTQDAETLRASLDADQLYIKLRYSHCVQPNTERLNSDVSNNGTYTDADIAEAARESAGMNALEILISMSATV